MNSEPTPQEIAAASPEPPPSQLQINRLCRVLRGEKGKFTIHVLFRSGLEVEFQADADLEVAYNPDLRCEIAGNRGYSDKGRYYIPWAEVLLARSEVNQE
jgi:hypothetical protein